SRERPKVWDQSLQAIASSCRSRGLAISALALSGALDPPRSSSEQKKARRDLPHGGDRNVCRCGCDRPRGGADTQNRHALRTRVCADGSSLLSDAVALRGGSHGAARILPCAARDYATWL